MIVPPTNNNQSGGRIVSRFILLSFLLAGLLCGGGCREERTAPVDQTSETGLTKVTLQLNWYPEAEHGGFYAAIEHGFFEEEGLEVEILPGGPGISVIKLVDQGQATFGVTNADDLLLQNAQGTEGVALMAPLQINPRCIMVHESSGITKLEDLSNLTLAMMSAKPFAQYLKAKLPLENVQIVEGPAIPKFLADENYAQQGYVFSEPFNARQQGGDPVSLLVSDMGFNPYSSILIATSGTVKDHPEIVGKMVRASLKGWTKYLSDPETTNKRIHDLNPEMSLEILAFGVEEMRPLCLPEGESSTVGAMTAERWDILRSQMIEIELITADSPEASTAYTLEFLETASQP